MPEIGEVARVVHYLRKHLVNRTVKTCQGFEDTIVFGKVGTSADAFAKAVEGRKVTGAGQQGKYFWITFNRPPHAVMHCGMTGYVKFSTEETGYYRQAKESETVEDWPPKYMKFLIKCEAEKVDGEDREPVEVAFVDARRLARIRLVDCEADEIRKNSPLKENGPDPVIDKNIVTVDWLAALLKKKKVPVKALLLDQGNISGIGNWVADETLYQARIHPEQYSNTFGGEEVRRLHDALIGVCATACETLADSKQFPEDWLMKYRWDKGKKDSNVLPNGNKIQHITVGGRTSAIVPAVQKKTAAVAGDVDEDGLDGDAKSKKPAKGRKRKSKAEDDDEDKDEDDDTEVMPAKKDRGKTNKSSKAVVNGDTVAPTKSSRGKKVKTEEEDENKEPSTTKSAQGKKADETRKQEAKPATPGSRRSSRNKAG